MLKNTFLRISALATLATPSLTFAVGEHSNVGTPDAPVRTLGDLLGIFKNLIDWFFYFVLLVAIAFFVYAGFLFITGGADEDKQKQARNLILYGVIGVAIALLAQAFVFITANLTGVNVDTTDLLQ